jgi:hypothetical protein
VALTCKYSFLLAVVFGATLVSARSNAQISPDYLPRDYEDCAEIAKRTAVSASAIGALLYDCNTKFAGRRKASGGYTYNDFMQGRDFDIAGPNPTAEELKQMDQSFMGYLDKLWMDSNASASAQMQQGDLGNTKRSKPTRAGLPSTSAPTNPARKTNGRSSSGRETSCEDNMLSCKWSNFLAGVKALLAPSPRTEQAPKP